MASEQILSRENFDTIVEIREVHIEKHRKGNAGREGETRADKVISDEREGDDKKEREGESHADRARSANIAQDKEAEEATTEKEGGSTGYVGKFEMKGEEKGSLSGEEAKGLRERAESDTSRVENERKGQVEAEQARTMDGTKEAQARQRAETQEIGGREVEERGREEARAEEVERSRLEAVSKYRAQALQKRMDSIASAQERAKQAATDEELGGAAAGDNAAKEYRERKKEEAERESEAKSVVQNQKSKEWPSAKSTTESFEREEQEQEGTGEPGAVCQAVGQERDKEHAQNMKGREGKGSKVFTTYADIVKDAAARKEQEPYEGEKEQPEGGVVLQMVKKPEVNPAEGGNEVLGAVGETVVEIGETMMKPAEKVSRQQGEEGKGGGVLGAIGETVAEIAQTTKVLVVGEGEAESRQSAGSEASE